MQQLLDAGEQLQRGDREAALRSLLAAWRETRAEEIAAVIEQLSAQLTEGLPTVTASGSSFRKAWLELAARQDPTTLDRLLAALPETRGGLAAERLAALKEWPADPRIVTAILRWLADPPFERKSRAQAFPAVAELLALQGDARPLPLLQRLLDPAVRPATVAAVGRSTVKPLAAAQATLSRLPPPLALPAESVAALERLSSRLAGGGAGRDTASLLGAIHADPRDTSLRLVYADALQQAGDPRGEFIALQCRRHGTGAAPSRREKELESVWGRAWLGAIDPWLLNGGLKFERGFVTAGRYEGRNVTPDVFALPEWTTLEALDVTPSGVHGGASGLLASKRLTSLREVIGMYPFDLERVAEAGPFPWTALEVMSFDYSRDTERALKQTTCLPALTRLALYLYPRMGTGELSGLTVNKVNALLGSALGKQLEALEVALSLETFGAICEVGRSLGRPARLALRCKDGTGKVVFEPAPDRVILELHALDDQTIQGFGRAVLSMQHAPRELQLTVPAGVRRVDGALVQRAQRCSLVKLLATLGALNETAITLPPLGAEA